MAKTFTVPQVPGSKRTSQTRDYTHVVIYLFDDKRYAEELEKRMAEIRTSEVVRSDFNYHTLCANAVVGITVYSKIGRRRQGHPGTEGTDLRSLRRVPVQSRGGSHRRSPPQQHGEVVRGDVVHVGDERSEGCFRPHQGIEDHPVRNRRPGGACDRGLSYLRTMKKTVLATLVLVFSLGLSACVKGVLRTTCGGHCVPCGTCRG